MYKFDKSPVEDIAENYKILVKTGRAKRHHKYLESLEAPTVEAPTVEAPTVEAPTVEAPKPKVKNYKPKKKPVELLTEHYLDENPHPSGLSMKETKQILGGDFGDL